MRGSSNGDGEMEQPSDDLAIASLPPVLDLTAAGPLAAEFLAHRGTPMMVDGSGVERMGAQCLQVLLAARNAWAADGNAFSIESPSGPFAETVTALGAADLLTPSSEESRA